MLGFGMTANAQTPGDVLRLSQYNYGFSTARSAAMGGAFTSLGADLSSMTLNPAGLGMYRSSEVSFSPSVTTNTIRSLYTLDGSTMGQTGRASKTRFSVGSLGAAFNIYNGGGGLTSATLGVGYTKLTDFNTSSFAQNSGSSISILDFFAQQVTGFTPGELGASTDADPHIAFRRIDPQYWGGILAYQTNMIDPLSDDPNETHFRPVLSDNTQVNPALRMSTTGSVGEYSISGGFNIQNIVYLGMTIGIQDIYYNNTNYYSEAALGDASERLSGLEYEQSHKMSGAGVNFKFGATVRPIDNLRIGLAIHTPTFISINEEYREVMRSFFNSPEVSKNRDYDSPFLLNDYDLQTPTRFLAGASYTWPGVGLITADYERVWYNGMKLSNFGNNRATEQKFNSEVKDLFRPANNFRVGIEATPMQQLYLRAGYAYYDNCMKINDAIFSRQANIKSYQNYSGGIGGRFGHFFVDLAYIYTSYKYAPYDIFFLESNQGIIDSGIIQPKQNRHTITLSLGARF